MGGVASGIGKAVGVAAPILGGVLGRDAASGDRGKALEYARSGIEAFQALDIPDEEKIQKLYEIPELVGLLQEIGVTPEQVITSGFDAIQVDPRLKQAQMGALQRLQQYSETPLTEQDKLALYDTRMQVAGDEQARQKSILQDMAQRGQAGSGNELAARLLSSQQATNRAARAGMNVASEAQQRALQAMTQAGGLAGNIRTQDYGQQADAARARDSINEFNARQRSAANLSNVENQRAVQAANLAARQQRVDMSRDARIKADQDRFGRLTTKAQGIQGGSNLASSAYQRSGDTIAKGVSDMWAGVGKAAGGASQFGEDKDV